MRSCDLTRFNMDAAGGNGGDGIDGAGCEDEKKLGNSMTGEGFHGF